MKQIILISIALCGMLLGAMATGENIVATKKAFSNSAFLAIKSLKRNAIKLTPNPTASGTVTIISNLNADLHVYVFDMTGVLLHQISLKGKERFTLTDLKKGMYMYDVFLEDESIEGGKIIVK